MLLKRGFPHFPLNPKSYIHHNNSLYSSLFYHYTPSFSTQTSYFSDKKFTDLLLTEYLQHSLLQKGFEYLTPIQSLSLPLTLQHKNALLNSEAGGGKTLCYILPILNYFLSKKQQESTSQPSPKGAVVLAPTKDLCTQIYALFRTLDPDNLIRVTRLGSMVTTVPLVQFSEDPNVTDKFLNNLSFQNEVNTTNFNDIDILVTTPTRLEDIMTEKDKKDPLNLNPKFLVLDEYDLLLGGDVYRESTISILRRLAGRHKSIFGDINLDRQFIFSGGTCQRNTSNSTIEEEIANTVTNIETFKTNDYLKLPKNLKCEYIKIQDRTSIRDQLQMLHTVLSSSSSKKIIVFCNSTEMVRITTDFLFKKGENVFPLHGSLPPDERIRALSSFKKDKGRILVSSDLGSRGLDFNGADHVIQFEFALSPSGVIARAGRTARCGQKGIFTSFVKEGDEVLAGKVKEAIQNGESFDDIFVPRRRIVKKEGRKVGQN